MMSITRTALLSLAVAGLAFLGTLSLGASRQGQEGQDEPSTRQKERSTVVSVARKAGTFNTLVKALEQAKLVETLQGDGPFTIFAPDDEAFKKLPTGTLQQLMKEDNQNQLKNILLYHVASGKLMAEQVTRLKEIETVEGSPITIDVADGKVILNGRVEITKTDIVADNGVIHVINGVLMPDR